MRINVACVCTSCFSYNNLFLSKLMSHPCISAKSGNISASFLRYIHNIVQTNKKSAHSQFTQLKLKKTNLLCVHLFTSMHAPYYV